MRLKFKNYHSEDRILLQVYEKPPNLDLTKPAMRTEQDERMTNCARKSLKKGRYEDQIPLTNAIKLPITQ